MVLMKALYVLLALSIVAIAAAVIALRWRLRWHLRRPHHVVTESAPEIRPEHESVEQK
jgi:hypothetical protein